jgi:hypothetical protein
MFRLPSRPPAARSPAATAVPWPPRPQEPDQDLIDRVFYALASLSEPDWRGLESRLARML